MLKAAFQSLYSSGVSQHLRGLMPFNGLSGMVHRALFSEFIPISGNRTVTVDDHNCTYTVNVNAVFTLPAVTADLKGMKLHAICAVEGAQATFTPASADGIYGTTNASTNVVFSGTDGAGIKNTSVSALKGDNITLMCDGSTGWYVVGCHGVWANV